MEMLGAYFLFVSLCMIVIVAFCLFLGVYIEPFFELAFIIFILGLVIFVLSILISPIVA